MFVALISVTHISHDSFEGWALPIAGVEEFTKEAWAVRTGMAPFDGFGENETIDRTYWERLEF